MKRSIPAWAGETALAGTDGQRPGVYPRVGGGNPAGCTAKRRRRGLSPRGRGKLERFLHGSFLAGSIPAWAGETGCSPGGGCGGWVYPRVGGGNLSAGCWSGLELGLSPRGRGKRCPAAGMRAALRSIPAWAGETRYAVGNAAPLGVYPRVGGGNLRDAFSVYADPGLSPRGRGKQCRRAWLSAPAGSIPAWAGETAPASTPRWSWRVYPRVGGGNRLTSRPIAWTPGLSPRGRGKPGPAAQASPRRRSIPAWAGETHYRDKRVAHCRVYPRVGGGNEPLTPWARDDRGLSPRGRGKLPAAQDWPGC